MTRQRQSSGMSDEMKLIRRRIARLDRDISNALKAYERIRPDHACFPLMLGDTLVSPEVVSDVFTELRSRYGDRNLKLDVILDCSGGDVDAAYNLSELLRAYAATELNIIIPRWAKNVGTLIACAGNAVYMTPVAELGPIDPLVIEYNPLERKIEKYSPLSVRATLRVIKDEFSKGNEKLAQKLMERMEFPLSLGGFQSILETARKYLVLLLQTRMLVGVPNGNDMAQNAASKLTSSYQHNKTCIMVDEARSLGLNVRPMEAEHLQISWEIYNLYRERTSLDHQVRTLEMRDKLEKLPPHLLDLVFPVVEEAALPDGGPPPKSLSEEKQ